MLLVAAGAVDAGTLAPQKASADSRTSTAQGQRLLAARSARFVENKGQWDSRASFLARGGDSLDLWFTQTGIRYDHHTSRSMSKGADHVVDMFFRGGHAIKPEGRRDVGSRSDYYTTGKPVVGVRSYHELYARNVVDGVDMRSYYDGAKPRYDLILAPGANPKALKLGFRGETGLSIQKGELRIGTKLGGFANGRPFAYQTVDGKQKPVAVRWALDGKSVATFALGAYDRSKALVIDPVVYGTYFGGDSGGDEVRAITSNTVAGGGVGSTLLTGATRATQFPTSTGFNNYNNPSGVDAFVSRLQGDAYNRDYALYFGGVGADTGQYIKLDAVGNVWIAGTTTSPQFFSTAGSTLNRPRIFVMRFTLQGNGFLQPTGFPTGTTVLPTGTSYVPATFGSDTANTSTTEDNVLTGFDVLKSSPATDASPTIIVLTGISTQAITGVPGTYPTDGDPTEPAPLGETGYVLRLNYTNNGSPSQQSSFTPQASSQYMVGDGGVVNETRGVVFATDGSFFIAGTAYGNGNQNTDPATGGSAALFQTTPGVFASTQTVYDDGRLLRGSDIFARHYDADGGIIYSGFIGGSAQDEAGGIALAPENLGSSTDLNILYTGSAIAVDAAGEAYVTGVSRSFNFPRTNGVYGETFDANSHVIVTKINASGSAFLFSTNLKTGAGETAVGLSAILPAGIAIDPDGNAFVTGNIRARDVNFPNPTPGDPNQPTGSVLPSINIPGNLTDVPDATNTSPTGTEFPTSEGFLMVIDSTGTTLQYATYIGGDNDDLVYAPYVDNNGDVWAMGWTDGRRTYIRRSSTGTVTLYDRFSSLPGTLISTPSLKTSIDTDTNTMNPQVVSYATGYGALATFGVGSPATVNMAYARDGFITKFRVNKPSVKSIVLNPAKIPGGEGATSTATVTLTQAAPEGGAQLTLDLLDGTAYASLAPIPTDGSSKLAETTVTIPQGQTTATFTIYSDFVPANETARVRATYTGTFQQATLQIVPWLSSFTISPSTAIGGGTIKPVGSFTLSAAAPVGGIKISFLTGSQYVTLTSITVPAGTTTYSQELPTAGVDAQTQVMLTAVLTDDTASPRATKSATFTLLPASLQSVVLNPAIVSGGTGSTVNVVLNGLTGSDTYASAYKVVLKSNDTSVKFVNADASDPTGTTQTVYLGAQKQTLDAAVAITTTPVVTTKTVAISATYSFVADTATPAVARGTASATLTVQAVNVTSLVLNPASVDSGSTSTATITVDTVAATGGTVILLDIDRPEYAQLNGAPLGTATSTVVIPAGQTSATFPVKARYVGADRTVKVEARQVAGTTPKTANLTVKAINYSVTFDKTRITGGTQGSNAITGTITLLKAGATTVTTATEDLTFQVTADAGLSPALTTVVLPAGSSRVTFTLTAGSVTSTSTPKVRVALLFGINGAEVGTQKTTTIQIDPIALNRVDASTTVLRGGDDLYLNAYLDAPVSVDTTFTVTISPSSAFTVVGGNTQTLTASASDPKTLLQLHLIAKRVSRSQNVTITVTANGVSKSVVVVVSR